jgi:Spy/CpxP family protein refolding chaperone
MLLAIGCFAAGIVAHSLFLTLTHKDPINRSPQEAKALEQEVRSLTEQLAEAQTENATLQTKLNDAPVFESFALSEENEEVHSVGSTRAISIGEGRFEEMMSRQVDQQLDIYTARLNLSAEQREQLKEVMLLRMTQMRLRFNPNGAERSEDENGAPMITQNDIDNLAAEILSPDQLDEYDEMRAQEIESRSEMMATAQLSQIAPQLGLTETQKDQVYSIYYNQSLEITEEFMDPERMQESQLLADEQVRDILNEEQREVFNTIKKNQNFGNFTIIAR